MNKLIRQANPRLVCTTPFFGHNAPRVVGLASRVDSRSLRAPVAEHFLVPRRALYSTSTNKPPSEQENQEDNQKYTLSKEKETEFKVAKDPKNAELNSFLSSFLKEFQSNFLRNTKGLLIILAITCSVYYISDWFSSITFKSIAQWSFSAGVVSTASVFLAYMGVKRYFILRSSKVYKATLRRIMEDSYVRDTLGAPCNASKFRAYSYYYPDTKQHEMEINLLRSLQFWKPVHMQMIFKVSGTKTRGTVSCDVSKLPSFRSVLKEEYVFHSLAVDLEDGERIILSNHQDPMDKQDVKDLLH